MPRSNQQGAVEGGAGIGDRHLLEQGLHCRVFYIAKLVVKRGRKATGLEHQDSRVAISLDL